MLDYRLTSIPRWLVLGYMCCWLTLIEGLQLIKQFKTNQLLAELIRYEKFCVPNRFRNNECFVMLICTEFIDLCVHGTIVSHFVPETAILQT